MFAYGIFKVIYAPRKAFKEIMQNPKYIGPILIMILFVLANLGFVFTVISKSYIEQTLPTGEKGDEWTENSTLWTPILGATIKENYVDFISGVYLGNRSIEVSMIDSTRIAMQLSGIGSVNCTGPDGYKNLTLRIKIVNPAVMPKNVTISLFSSIPSDSFCYNLTARLANSTINVWNNLTIPLLSGWTSNSSNANWGDIKGLKLEFTWLDTSNITVLIDGLFFRGIFKSPMEVAATSYFLNFSLVSFMEFVIQWVSICGLIYIMSKAFKAQIAWRPLLVLVGFALITLFVHAILNIAAFSTLPNLYYSFEFIGGVPGESDRAISEMGARTWLVSTFLRVFQIAAYLWTILLCAMVIRYMAEFSWGKSLLIAVVAFAVTLMIESFIGI